MEPLTQRVPERFATLAERTEHVAYLSLFHADQASLGLATGAWDQAMSDAEFAGAGYCPR